jgi:hypothetical protein
MFTGGVSVLLRRRSHVIGDRRTRHSSMTTTDVPGLVVVVTGGESVQQ